MLPGMDGFEVCRHIRSDPLIKHLPVLMMTARGEEIDQLIGFQMGADDYVTKPFKMRVLLERIKSLLRRTEGLTDDETGRLSSDGIVVDRIQFKVTVGGEDVALTPSEFDLLWHLMKHPGRVFNRAELMNAIMGDDTIVLERTIDVHIRGLRKKLGDCGDYVETVRGVGYRYKIQ
jgi:two-component system phosphate regulon response regulator PhoB